MNRLPGRVVVSRAFASVALLGAVIGACRTAPVRSDAHPENVPGPRVARAGVDLPVELPGLPQRSILRAPSVTVDGDDVYVVANLFEGDTVVGPTAYLGQLHRGPRGLLEARERLRLPPGDFQFAYPRIVGRGGQLHLVWVELANRWATNQAWASAANVATSLWHAVMTNGTWSVPERIATAAMFGWDTDAGGVALDSTGVLHVVAWTGIEDAVPRVVDYRWSTGRWQGVPLPYRPALRRATAVAAREDAVIVAMMDVVADTVRAMVVSSADHGADWGRPFVAYRGIVGTGTVSRLAIAPAGDGLLVGVGHRAPAHTSFDTLTVSRLTRDLETVWRRSIDLPPSVDGFDLVGAECGDGRLLLRTFSTAPQLYTTLLPARGTPSAVEALQPGARSLFPTLGAWRDAAVAVFGTGSDTTPFRNVAVRLPLCS